MMPETSVAGAGTKTNAAPWKSTALHAAQTALRSVGEHHVELRWRQGRLDEDPWAAFDAPTTGDVIWVAQVDGTSPPGTLAGPTEFGDMGVWRHPNDPALPGLPAAVTPNGVQGLITPVAPDVDTMLVEVVAIHPLERAVIRVGHQGQAVYVKVLPPWRVGVVADRHRRVQEAGVPSPSVLAVVESMGWLVLGELRGLPLADHLESGGPLPHVDDVWRVIQTLVRAGTVHGDLHDRQLLVDDRGSIVGVVDVDDVGSGELVDDLGRLLAHMSWRGVTHPEQAPRIRAWVEELAEVFDRRVDPAALRDRVAQNSERLRRLSRTSDGAATPP